MKVVVRNKSAFRNFEHKATFVGGLKLSGAEVKSLKASQGSLQGAYLSIHNMPGKLNKHQLVVKNLYIPPYQIKNMPGGYDPYAQRIVLVEKRELNQIMREMNNKGTTLIPISIGLSNNLVKVEFALARGKKMHDKRQALKERAQRRDTERAHNVQIK